MAEKLVFDTDALQQAATELNDAKEMMTQLKEELHNAVENLRTIGWQTEAGTKFFDKFDNTWEKNLANYIAVIEHMSSNTSYAQSEYEKIVEEANAIKLQSK